MTKASPRPLPPSSSFPQVPVVHGCSVLPAPADPHHLSEGGYIREVRQLDYGEPRTTT